MNLFRYFGRTPQMGNQLIARPLLTQDRTIQKNVDIHPCLEQGLIAESQCSSGPRSYVPQTAWPLGLALLPLTSSIPI
jgi:hypothetical protein